MGHTLLATLCYGAHGYFLDQTAQELRKMPYTSYIESEILGLHDMAV